MKKTENINLRPGACRFSLSPMTDDFIDIILGAVGRTDTSLVSRATGRLSTVYRGGMSRVEDAVKSCFTGAFRQGVHMTMEASFFPDAGRQVKDGPLPGREKKGDFPVTAKFSLYPLDADCRDGYIEKALSRAKEAGVLAGDYRDCRLLSGTADRIFSFIDLANRRLSDLPRYTLRVTFSVNSPTPED